MKILHMVSSLDPRSGGPTRSVQGLCRSLARCGVDTTLFAHHPGYPFENRSGAGFLTGKGLGLARVIFDASRTLDQVRPDVLHLHGVWSAANHVDVVCSRRRAIPYVIAPRGMLEPWSLNAKKWKKRLAMWLYQRRDLKHAVALHATAESEAEQFRRLGFTQPIIVSPNGVDLPGQMPPRTRREDGKKTILFLSRIHPKKGILELIEAWGRCRECLSDMAPDCRSARRMASGGGTETSVFEQWHVEYAGPDCGGHLSDVRRRIKELELERAFTYLGDLSDVDKWQAYRRADLFVLPTYSENFGIVVAEALAAGVPVITTKGTPWAELLGSSDQSSVIGDRVCSVAGGRCGWWIDIGVEPLAETLREAVGLSDEERRAMGENGRRLVEAKYTWPAIAEQMKAAYEWIANGREPPESVSIG